MPSQRPAFQFYVRDWIAHPGLTGCSLAARGLWMACVCIMHDAPMYGRLLNADGSPMTADALARRVGESAPRVKRLLGELLTNGVGHKADDGTIESPRMMRDEDRRNRRAAGGALGGNPNLPRRAKDNHKDNGKVNLARAAEVNGDVNQKPTPASASASASSLPLQKEHPRKPRAGSNGAPPESWLTPALTAWEAHFGAGSFSAKRAAACLSTIYRAGIEPSEIGRRLGRYCTRKKGTSYCKLEDFAQHHGEYALPAGPLVDADGVLTELGDRETRPARVQT